MTQTFWGWSYVIAGTALVGVGGLLATLGWNKVQSGEQQRNAIVSLVQELRLNDAMIVDALGLVGRWPVRGDGENFSYELYHSTHLAAAVTSGRHSRASASDREELGALETYLRTISSFNTALGIVGRTNSGLFLRRDLINVSDTSDWPATPEDALAEQFQALIDAHDAVKSILEQRYPWAAQSSDSRESHAGT